MPDPRERFTVDALRLTPPAWVPPLLQPEEVPTLFVAADLGDCRHCYTRRATTRAHSDGVAVQVCDPCLDRHHVQCIGGCDRHISRYEGNRTFVGNGVVCSECLEGGSIYRECRHCGGAYRPLGVQETSHYPVSLPAEFRTRTCPRCVRYAAHECARCHAWTGPSSVLRIRTANGGAHSACQTCLTDNDRECGHCSMLFDPDDQNYLPEFPYTETRCGTCATNYVTCCGCSDWILHDDGHYVESNNSLVCDRCESNFPACTVCGDRWDRNNDDGQCCDDSDDGDDDDDGERNGGGSVRCRCADCTPTRRSSGEINYYSFRPDPIFHGDGPVFLGMELELSVPGRENAAIVANKILGGIAYLKEDGSIGGGGGFELVTHPMSYEWAMGSFPWQVLPKMAAHGARSHSSCGMHVHVSRTGFAGQCHEYRWLKFWHRNAGNMQLMARRSDSRWAAFNPDSRKAAKAIATKKGSDQRYVAINPQNRDTYEVRVFASSMVEEEIKASLGLVAATVEYTRGLRSKDVLKGGGWGWEAFRRWLDDKPHYAPLIRQMDARTGTAPLPDPVTE